LDDLGKGGFENLQSIVKAVGDNGAESLGTLIGSRSSAAFQSVLESVSKKGAAVLSDVMEGLSHQGRATFQTVLGGLEGKGAKIFVQALNQAENGKALSVLFNNLTDDGANALSGLFNEIQTLFSGGAKKLMAVMGALDEPGGKAFATILNMDGAAGNLKTVIKSLSKKSAEIFGRALNGLTDEGADVMAQAFAGFSKREAKQFAKFVGQVGDADAIAGFVNGLAKTKQGSLLGKIFKDLSSKELKKVAGFLKNLSGSGGERFGVLLGKMNNGQILLLKEITTDQIKGLAAFLNATTDVSTDSMAKLLSGDLGRRTLRILGEGGEAAGKSLATLLDAVGSDKYLFARMLISQDDLTKVLISSLKEMGTEGAELFGKVLRSAINEQEVDDLLINFMRLHAADDIGGEVLGRLFLALGRANADPVVIKTALQSLASNESRKAGLWAGRLLAEGLAEGGKLSVQSADGVAKAAMTVLGKTGGQYADDLFDGVLKVGGQLAEEGLKKKSVQKAIVKAFLDSGALTGAQRSSLKEAVKRLGKDGDDLLPLFTFDNFLTESNTLNFLGRSANKRLGFMNMLISDPLHYQALRFGGAVSWASFGLSGVGTLVPFGYDPDVLMDGEVVEGEGWFMGWRDPTTKRRVTFGRAAEIVFFEWGGAYGQWRVQSTKEMFMTGLRISAMLHVFAFQPGATGHWLLAPARSLAKRGTVGSAARLLRIIPKKSHFNFASLAQGASKKLVSKSFGVFGKRGAALAESKFGGGLTHTMGLFLGGWEGVIPFVAISGAGHAAGAELSRLYLPFFMNDEEEIKKKSIDIGEVTGLLAMFLVPMAGFGSVRAGKLLQGASSAKGRAPSVDAVNFAKEVSRTSATDGKVDLIVGLQRATFDAKEIQQLKGAAARVFVLDAHHTIPEAKQVLGRVLEVMNNKENRETESKKLKAEHPELSNFDDKRIAPFTPSAPRCPNNVCADCSPNVFKALANPSAASSPTSERLLEKAFIQVTPRFP